jgi:hypothetical protein
MSRNCPNTNGGGRGRNSGGARGAVEVGVGADTQIPKNKVLLLVARIIAAIFPLLSQKLRMEKRAPIFIPCQKRIAFG